MNQKLFSEITLVALNIVGKTSRDLIIKLINVLN